jgi:hypothetical protein
MGAREKLLNEPPAEFESLKEWLHQDFGFEVTPERGIGGYLADRATKHEAVSIAKYIDALLAREDIDNGDLKGLLRRSWDLRFKADGARLLLSTFRDELRTRANSNA